MRFLLDPFLVGLGHDVRVVGVDLPPTTLDETVLVAALQDNLVVITNDTDFGELAVRHGRAHAGIILLRLDPTDIATKLDRLAVGIAACAENPGCLVVVTERRVRIRRT